MFRFFARWFLRFMSWWHRESLLEDNVYLQKLVEKQQKTISQLRSGQDLTIAEEALELAESANHALAGCQAVLPKDTDWAIRSNFNAMVQARIKLISARIKILRGF